MKFAAASQIACLAGLLVSGVIAEEALPSSPSLGSGSVEPEPSRGPHAGGMAPGGAGGAGGAGGEGPMSNMPSEVASRASSMLASSVASGGAMGATPSIAGDAGAPAGNGSDFLGMSSGQMSGSAAPSGSGPMNTLVGGAAPTSRGASTSGARIPGSGADSSGGSGGAGPSGSASSSSGRSSDGIKSVAVDLAGVSALLIASACFLI